MKKWIFGLLAILIVFALFVYLFIPSKIVISTLNPAKATIGSEFRNINQEEKWQNWWRDANGKPHMVGKPFTYSQTSFRITGQASNVIGIEIEHNGMKLPSVLNLVSLSADTTAAFWQLEMPKTNYPLTRFQNFLTALKIKMNMARVMNIFNSFLSDPKNLYGFTFAMTSTKDTTLLSARFISQSYPTTTEMYTYFNAIDQSIQKQHGTITGFPMINVRKMEEGTYETQVAIPTGTLLENDGKIVNRRMVPGNFVVSEVKGGPFTIAEAQKQMNFYIKDHQKEVIANPFQLLITDRMKEPDTLKWITRLFIPVVK